MHGLYRRILPVSIAICVVVYITYHRQTNIEEFQKKTIQISSPLQSPNPSRTYGQLTMQTPDPSWTYGQVTMQTPDPSRTYRHVVMQTPDPFLTYEQVTIQTPDPSRTYGQVAVQSHDISRTYENKNSSLHEKCAELPKAKTHIRVPLYFYSKANNVAFCKAPKTGSTFIGTVVKALERNGDLVRNMFHVNRESVHGRNEATLDTIVKQNSQGLKIILVTRNPFTRLFSAYLDKYFVLGMWGKQMAKNLGKDHRKIREGFCGFDISFQEFLDYVTDASLGDKNTDEHTLPVSSLCNPCSVRYDVICKQETLTSDTEHVLKLINITEQKRLAIVNMIRGKTLTDTIFSWISSHLWYYIVYKKDCSSKILLIERLWQVLQLQGYINTSLTFPARLFKNLPVFRAESVTTLILKQIRSSPLTESQTFIQRTRVLQQAYGQIKPATIARVQTMFAQDFQLFDYDRSPPHI